MLEHQHLSLFLKKVHDIDLDSSNMSTYNPCHTPAEPIQKLDASSSPVADPTLFLQFYKIFSTPDIH